MQFAEEMKDPETAHKVSEIKDFVVKTQGRSTTLSSMMGFSAEELKASYSAACQKLLVNDLFEAGKLFFFLCTLKHDEAKHWRGLGIVMQRYKSWALAEVVYSTALRVDPSDLISRVFRAECLMWTNRRIAARAEVERALEDGKSNQDPKLLKYIKRAQAILAVLDRDEHMAAEFEH